LQRPLPQKQTRSKMNIIGIDYGSKTAGTTALCYAGDSGFSILQSKKKEDADAWILAHVNLLRPHLVMLDAPLSLPAAYVGGGTDFFYRRCDRELKAMSPLFIGGLTARAMQLAHGLRQQGIDVKEVYPRQVQRALFPGNRAYKKSLPAFRKLLQRVCEYTVPPLKNWHQADAVLAWLGGWRWLHGQGHNSGDPAEGVIYW